MDFKELVVNAQSTSFLVILYHTWITFVCIWAEVSLYFR